MSFIQISISQKTRDILISFNEQITLCSAEFGCDIRAVRFMLHFL